MLKVILLNKAVDLYSLDFIDNPELPTTLVLPNPLLADNLRERFLEKEVDLITISRFVNNELKEEREDKAHLIFDLLKCFKKQFKNPSFEKFLHSFNHFTDLRSFSLEFSPFEDVLPFLDEEIAKAITLFWKEVSDRSLVDEHHAYFKLSEKFKDQDYIIPKNIIFYGFNHLSNLQVEMVQALSRHYNVFIPFLKRVYVKCQSSDWIKWIDTTFDFREELEESPNAKGKVAFYPENKMAEFLSICTISDKKVDFYLLSKDLDFNLANEIPFHGLNFKVKNDLFSPKLKAFFKTLPEKNAVEEIEKRFKTESEKDFHGKDFRLLKIISLIKENLKYFPRELDRFDLNALEYVVSLKLPRTYTTPLIKNGFKGEIRGRGSLLSYEPKNLNIVIVPSGNHSISIGTTKYPKQVEECLFALGPIQNPYLEFLNTQELLREIFEDESTLLIAPFGSEKENEAVEQIISKVKILEILEVNSGKEYIFPKDPLEQYIVKAPQVQKTLSATKLQNYLDCPRKFYFSYLNKIHAPETKEEFSHLHLGNLQHLIIGKFLEKNEVFDQEILEKILDEEFEKFILENKMIPTGLEKEKARIEIKNYSYHGIIELLKLKKGFPDGMFLFEKDLIPSADIPINGRLDVLFSCSEGYGILDFKRGSGSIPSGKELFDFKKIQPWVYLNHYPVEGKNCLFLGYLNLSSPKESLIFCNNSSIQERLRDFNFEAKTSIVEKTMSQIKEEFFNFEIKKFEEINLESQFLPIPQDSKSCNYCPVNQVCSKEVF